MKNQKATNGIKKSVYRNNGGKLPKYRERKKYTVKHVEQQTAMTKRTFPHHIIFKIPKAQDMDTTVKAVRER